MLDRRMVYTCAYWKDAKTLDEAQENKLDLVARKLQLKPGDRILDIGCGWGSFLIYAAEKYGTKGVGITVSKEQLALAKERTGSLPIEYRLQDYREVNDAEKFDKIVSLGMFEHVGYKNYDAFMEVAHRNLKDDGLFLLHTFGNSESVHYSDPWFEKYIFPNSMIPSMTQVGRAVEKRFVFEDVHNIGYNYYPTLMAWFKNFDAAWPELKADYDERFYRMWKYYLLSAAGMFKAREAQIFQFVFSKNGVPGGYNSVR
jgi:cyclopropane-fatty-acyl-phospholipid synthase